ncbi:MAG: GNAT family N-acetyltransferase [Vicinamibacterales bacterium]
MAGEPAIDLLPLDRLDDVVDVYAEAFAGYPVMRCTVGEDGDVAARERRLIRLFVTRRTARGGPMYGVSGSKASKASKESKESKESKPGELLGAILLTMPREPEPPPDVAEMAAAAWRDLGEDARLRYEAYAETASRLFPAEPHHHLNMIGVRPSHKGSGIGRRLLEFVRRMAEDDPESAGVSLSTENPRNVDLYRHVGYEVTGHAPIRFTEGAPAYETWSMFLRIR